jgi:hypothetical protein
MFNREIFRKKALDKLSTPDDLDEILQVNSSVSWLLMISLLCIVLGGVVWGIFGQIVNKVTMTGILQPVNPPLSLIMSEPGQIDSIFCRAGDSVFKGQPIVKYIVDKTSSAKYLFSPGNGELVELNIREGLFISQATTVAKIESFQRKPMIQPEFLFFVSDKMVGSLIIGEKVNILITGSESLSIRINTLIKYIGKIAVSEESISNIIPDKEEAARLKKGNYFLVRTEYVPESAKINPFNGFSSDELAGRIFYGEVIISRVSPISYLLNPSK